MAEALYRKYRPHRLSDVVGQPHIIETLTKALKSGRIRHAYLFSGPKGVGKTSVARILAHAVNQLPYKDDSVHLDIIEIDAASNRRIDEIRDLRDKVHITPAVAKYKVYIIDEVHMLTREAFNALLKTLEEPPAHCIFILATTEAHKLPETIISRTQHFTFKPVEKTELTKHLAQIAKQEKININEEAIELVADYEHGSVRDSVSLLDRLGGSGGKITGTTVHELIGMASDKSIDDILKAIDLGQSSLVLAELKKLQSNGVNPIIASKQISAALRQYFATGQTGVWAIKLLKELLEIPASINPEQILELCLLEAATRRNTEVTGEAKQAVIKKDIEPETKPDNKKGGNTETQSTAKLSPVNKSKPAGLNLDDWPKILAETKASQPGLYSALRLAKPQMIDGELVLAFEFALHQKKIAQKSELALLSKILNKVSGTTPVVRAIVDKKSTAEAESPKPTNGTSLESISNIFDGAEVLES